jgi:HD-like signal output (HDOD) protein
LKQLLANTNSSIYEIVALIRLDPGIATRVIQVSNSAYFSRGGVGCDTVEEAVGRVGYDHIFELVSFAVASQVLVRPLAVYSMANDEVWRLSVACAFAAEELAIYGEIERDVAYTVGLVHGVGMVAIDEWALRQKTNLRFKYLGYPVDASADERQHFGFTQAEVGSELLREWDFPTIIEEPVRCQYTPAAADGHARMAGLLAVAKWIRSSVCDQRPLPPLPSALLKSMRLSNATLDKIAQSVGRRLEGTTSLLDAPPAPLDVRQRSDAVKYPKEFSIGR